MAQHFGTNLVGFQFLTMLFSLNRKEVLWSRRKPGKFTSMLSIQPISNQRVLHTHHNHFGFLVLPFGLTNAPSSFQSLTNCVFDKLFYPLLANIFEAGLSPLYEHLIQESQIVGLTKLLYSIL